MNNKISDPVFVITIDTESDDAWTKPESIKLDNLKGIPRFQDLCEKHNVVPTYLVTYECAARDEAIKVFKPILDRGKCEIGHHLHTWSTPPFQREDGRGVDLDWIHAYQSELPEELFFAKAETLRAVIEKNYGASPTSHRAGRWGIDTRTLNWLINNNFLVDTSVLPLTDFSKMLGKFKTGPNFFFESFNTREISNAGRQIIEIPVTVRSSPALIIEMLKFAAKTRIISNRNAYKVIRKFGGGTKLTPSMDFKVDQYLNTIHGEFDKGRRVINFSLHSTELSFGHSPITKTMEGYEYFWLVLEKTFELISELNIKSSSLSNATKYLN
jgi:hypothetical protein